MLSSILFSLSQTVKLWSFRSFSLTFSSQILSWRDFSLLWDHLNLLVSDSVESVPDSDPLPESEPSVSLGPTFLDILVDLTSQAKFPRFNSASLVEGCEALLEENSETTDCFRRVVVQVGFSTKASVFWFLFICCVSCEFLTSPFEMNNVA